MLNKIDLQPGYNQIIINSNQWAIYWIVIPVNILHNAFDTACILLKRISKTYLYLAANSKQLENHQDLLCILTLNIDLTYYSLCIVLSVNFIKPESTQLFLPLGTSLGENSMCKDLSQKFVFFRCGIRKLIKILIAYGSTSYLEP